MRSFFLAAMVMILSIVHASAQLITRHLSGPAITILSTEPQQPVEGMQVTVYFKLVNNSNAVINGWVAADMNSSTGAPSSSPVDWTVKELGPSQTILGAVKLTAVNAGMQKTMRVFFYTGQTKTTNGNFTRTAPVNPVSKNMDVALLLNFRLMNFTVKHTRARSTDTNYGALAATMDGQPVMQPASIFVGDVQNGEHNMLAKANGTKFYSNAMNLYQQQVDYLQTGPVAIIPGSNNHLQISYVVFNGGGVTDRDRFMTGLAQATATPSLFDGQLPGGKKWVNALKVLCPMINFVGGCDGLVALDSVTINTGNLYLFNSSSTITRSFHSEEYASQTGCGNTSNYDVQSEVTRVSATGGSSIKPLVFANTYSGKTMKLASDDRFNSISPPVWQRIETMDASGNFHESNDPGVGYVANGIYHAPANIQQQKLVILRGYIPAMNDMSSGKYLIDDINKAGITAIVQLLPGSPFTTDQIDNINNNTHPVTVPQQPIRRQQ